MKTLLHTCLALALAAPVAACATAPTTVAERDDLKARSDGALDAMIAKDPGLDTLTRDSYGYVVFPRIGKGGAIVGAAYGRGVMYIHDKYAGYVEVNQGSIGAQLGGQTFAELIVLRDRFAAEQIRTGQFSIGANISAVAIKTGAAASTRFTDGVAVFVNPHGGLMAELSVSGQKLNFDGG
ncbi:MAG TPA: lipid-binding SYLF domain-containing protein [Kofleriaceae bacterium]|jgi:lipid-binding SYLF domain-containing protein